MKNFGTFCIYPIVIFVSPNLILVPDVLAWTSDLYSFIYSIVFTQKLFTVSKTGRQDVQENEFFT